MRFVPDEIAEFGENGKNLIAGPQFRLAEESFDLVVLSVGMEISELGARSWAAELGVELDDYGFCHTALFNPLQTSRPGIYAAGPFREPKDIPESVIDASGRRGVGRRPAGARPPHAHPHGGIPARAGRGRRGRRAIGVFVCHCGSNIGGFLDVPAVCRVRRLASRRGARRAQPVHLLAGQHRPHHRTGQGARAEPGGGGLLHPPHPCAALPGQHPRAAGLNPALFEMANIRNQCSWVHSHDREAATDKAKDLVRMAVARAGTLQPLSHSQMRDRAPGAGRWAAALAGMTAALSLAEGGFGVASGRDARPELGGNLRRVYSST